MPDRIVRAVFYKLHGDRLTRRLFRRVNGHRGRFLILFALIYLCVGYSYIRAGATPGRKQTFSWLPDWFPITALAWPWIIAAILAIASAIKYHPPKSDRLGFGALAVLPMVWAFLFLFSWMAGSAPTGWISVITYGGFFAAVVLVSSWPNPVQINGSSLLDGEHE